MGNTPAKKGDQAENGKPFQIKTTGFQESKIFDRKA